MNYDPKKYKKVLFLTYRKTLSKGICKSFEHDGFKNYLKIATFHHVDRFICQYESIKKLFEENENPFDNGVTDALDFDLVIIDEAKSFLIIPSLQLIKKKTSSTSKG